MLIQIQDMLPYKKCALLFLFVAIHFGVHAMQPLTQPFTKEVQVFFTEKQDDKDITRDLTINTKRFPFFAAPKRFAESSGQQRVNAPKEISFAAMSILKNLDTVIAGDEGKKIETSFKLGTYNIPPTVHDQLSEDTLSVEGLQALIHSADYIIKPDLAQLILYEYATRIVNKPILPKSTKEKTALAIDHAKFTPDLDKQLAKIILDRALINKVKYTATPMYLFGPNARVIATTRIASYLCPTASQNTLLLVMTKPAQYESSIRIMWFKLGNYGRMRGNMYTLRYPYKMPAHDSSYDRLKSAFIAISDNATCNLHIIDLDLLGEPQERQVVPLGNEAEAANSKLIFKRSSHDFYLKFNNKIYLCNTDSDQIVQTQIDENKIDDVWAKKYLSEDDAMAHSCAKMTYDSAPTASYFNTSCLHALEFEKKQWKALEDQLADIYPWENPIIIQCACDSEHNTHYYLSKTDRDEDNYYNLTNISFEPDVQAQKMIDFMNKTMKETPDRSLYPQALYIYYAYTNNWALTPAELSEKMGILDTLVSPEIKQMIAPPSWITRTKYSISQYTQPYMNYLKPLGLLSLGVIGLTLVNKLSPNFFRTGTPEEKKAAGLKLLLMGAWYYLLRPKPFNAVRVPQ